MTKQHMIQTIQQQEARAFLRLKEATRSFGANHPETNARRREWCTLDDVMQAAGIQPDNFLPEQHIAVAIIRDLDPNQNI